jgi:serine/threonine protein phosphatase PrpC
VGDSRAYWIDGAGARQLTSDHSWLNEVVSSGEMTFEEAMEDSRAHAITRWLGGDSGENAKPDIVTFPVPGPGALLICSDGLWNYAPSEGDMAELFGRMEGDAIVICRGLVEFAKERGGQDNITAAVLRFGEANGERIQS